jgi:hypothetical protein
MRNFIDEDLTGFTHKQIWSSIVAEEEEQQCAEDGHRWYPVFICRTCGESFELGERKVDKKKIRTTMNHVIKLLEEQEGRK